MKFHDHEDKDIDDEDKETPFVRLTADRGVFKYSNLTGCQRDISLVMMMMRRIILIMQDF